MLNTCVSCRDVLDDQVGDSYVCSPCITSIPLSCDSMDLCPLQHTTTSRNPFHRKIESECRRSQNILSGGCIININNNILKNHENDDDEDENESLCLRISNPIKSIQCNILSRSYLEKLYSFIRRENDFYCISSCLNFLNISSFYYPGLSWKESMKLLMPTKPGTYLVRDSSDSKFLFSISVQTKCGPTSIRVFYNDGNFRLDSDECVQEFMPKFPCVLKLIEYYIERTKGLPLTCLDSGYLIGAHSQIILSTPLYTKGKFPSLKHLARLVVNKKYADTYPMPSLPKSIVRHLGEYPYRV